MPMAIMHEDGTVDSLLMGLWSGANEQALVRWQQQTPELHEFIPDLHRLQLEYWIWSQRGRLAGRVLDIGVENARRWLGPGYMTLGFDGCDLDGDLTCLPFADGSYDAIICTEVLEHCESPFDAVQEMYRVLRPGGLLMVTSPFIWPDHHTESYPDFWRFTAQGWMHLLAKVARFTDLHITRCEWSTEGAEAWSMVRRWEGMGFRGMVDGTTGYLVEATKGGYDDAD